MRPMFCTASAPVSLVRAREDPWTPLLLFRDVRGFSSSWTPAHLRYCMALYRSVLYVPYSEGQCSRVHWQGQPKSLDLGSRRPIDFNGQYICIWDVHKDYHVGFWINSLPSIIVSRHVDQAPDFKVQQLEALRSGNLAMHASGALWSVANPPIGIAPRYHLPRLLGKVQYARHFVLGPSWFAGILAQCLACVLPTLHPKYLGMLPHCPSSGWYLVVWRKAGGG